ncbi:MAG: PadR family transcriptional regulator [Longimicrobiales bacterium]
MRMTHPTALVLLALSRGARHGFDIIDATGLSSGTVYPILRRLEDTRLARSTWEAVGRARMEGRPPRRNYRITAAGTKAVAEALERYPNLQRLLDGGEGSAPASA